MASMVAAATLLMASFPVLLFATAGLIARYSNLSLELAQLIVGAAAILVALMIMGLAIRSLKSLNTVFSRSREEFKLNLAWLKSIFRSTK